MKTGGADRVRTDDLRLAKPALFRLSYSPRLNQATPKCWLDCVVVGLERIELPTSPLSGVRSIPTELQTLNHTVCVDVLLHLRSNFFKGGDPAPGSPRATLLRLHPSHESHRGKRPPRKVRLPTSGTTHFHGVTGGVYKARERIHRGVLIRDY